MCSFWGQAFLSIHTKPHEMLASGPHLPEPGKVLAEMGHQKANSGAQGWLQHRRVFPRAAAGLGLSACACFLSNTTLPCSSGQGHLERLSLLCARGRDVLGHDFVPSVPSCKQECSMGQQLSLPLSGQSRKSRVWAGHYMGTTLLCNHGTHKQS